MKATQTSELLYICRETKRRKKEKEKKRTKDCPVKKKEERFDFEYKKWIWRHRWSLPTNTKSTRSGTAGWAELYVVVTVKKFHFLSLFFFFRGSSLPFSFFLFPFHFAFAIYPKIAKNKKQSISNLYLICSDNSSQTFHLQIFL